VGPFRRWLASTFLVLSVLAGVVAMHGLGVDHDLHVGTAMPAMAPASGVRATDHRALTSIERDPVAVATWTGTAPGAPHDGHAMATTCLAILLGTLALAHLMVSTARGTRTTGTAWSASGPPAGRLAPRRMSLLPSQLQILRT
jgi:hypothetical protein